MVGLNVLLVLLQCPIVYTSRQSNSSIIVHLTLIASDLYPKQDCSLKRDT